MNLNSWLLLKRQCFIASGNIFFHLVVQSLSETDYDGICCYNCICHLHYCCFGIQPLSAVDQPLVRWLPDCIKLGYSQLFVLEDALPYRLHSGVVRTPFALYLWYIHHIGSSPWRHLNLYQRRSLPVVQGQSKVLAKHLSIISTTKKNTFFLLNSIFFNFNNKFFS